MGKWQHIFKALGKKKKIFKIVFCCFPPIKFWIDKFLKFRFCEIRKLREKAVLGSQTKFQVSGLWGHAVDISCTHSSSLWGEWADEQ